MSQKILFLFFVLLIFSVPAKASFCACCAEEGEYSISVRKPLNDELEILKQIQFATANLYTNASYPENIRGISPLEDGYSVSGLWQSRSWKMNFKDNKGKTGILSLPMPATMVSFMVDTFDREPVQTGGGPVLYKEWRFKYKVAQGTGIFQNGIAPATEYFLVLQGRGNNCANLSDFRTWRLEITGKKASYAFYGKLKTTS
jgi:hypothetical protein